MLVLTRRVGEEIVIDRHIRLTVLGARGNVIRLGIVAPESVRVLRQELFDRQTECEAAVVLPPEGSGSSNDSGIMGRLIRVAR